jgi:hypothetical protein
MQGLTDPSKYSKRARISNNSTGQDFLKIRTIPIINKKKL